MKQNKPKFKNEDTERNKKQYSAPKSVQITLYRLNN